MTLYLVSFRRVRARQHLVPSYIPLYLDRVLAHEEIGACEPDNGLAYLVDRLAGVPDDPKGGTALGGYTLEYDEAHMERITWADRMRLEQFVDAGRSNVGGIVEQTSHQQAHAERRRVPTARHQSAKE